MGLIPETTCLRCGMKYSGIRPRCPKCGAPRTSQPTRVPPTSAAATPRTAASARSAVNIRWQFVFGGILLVAIILAVIVLISTGGKSSSSSASSGTASSTSSSSSTQSGGSSVYTAADLPSPSPSPEPTPEASPTPPIESMSITFLNSAIKKDLTISQEGTLSIDLDLSTYPATDAPVTWTSSNDTILTVDDKGVITIVGASPTKWVHAVITAECLGISTSIQVYVPSYQASYLTNNLFDEEKYQADCSKWDPEFYTYEDGSTMAPSSTEIASTMGSST